MEDKDVKLYTLSTCSHCKSTKRLLAECTIEYDFVDVDLLEGEERKAILEDIKKVNPRCSFLLSVQLGLSAKTYGGLHHMREAITLNCVIILMDHRGLTYWGHSHAFVSLGMAFL